MRYSPALRQYVDSTAVAVNGRTFWEQITHSCHERNHASIVENSTDLDWRLSQPCAQPASQQSKSLPHDYDLKRLWLLLLKAVTSRPGDKGW